MKIVIGVDGSPCSRAAIEFVQKMPWPSGTRVSVVSAVSVPAVVSAEVYVPTSGVVEELMAREMQTHQELASQVERTLRDAGLATDARVLQGDPREVIVQAARDAGADLVVVGSHGRSGLAKLLMGSVASHVVTHAPCSVTVVKARVGV